MSPKSTTTRKNSRLSGDGQSPPTVSNGFPAIEADIDRQLSEIESKLIDIRRHLHSNPEPSRQERETSRYIVARLGEAGIEGRLCRDGLGVIADLDIGQPGPEVPRIAIRSDIDALWIQDIKTSAYASKRPGLCHACGHDAHTSIVLGAALTSARLNHDSRKPSPWGAKLRFIFQPAEECAEGARWMVEQGAVEDVGAIIAGHVDPERQWGTVGVRYGALTANCDEVEVIVEGKGGHAARPYHTRDPIAAAAHLITALYEFLPRSVDSRNPSVFSVGKVSGGTLPNVIPDKVEILGSLRTLDQQTRTRLKDRIEEIVHGAKEASGTAMHLRFFEPIDGVYNDPRITSFVEEAAIRVIGRENVQEITQASMGGEDFAEYLTRVPGSLLRIGCAPPGFTAPFLHAPDFDVDERVIVLGSRILLRAALLLSSQGHSTE